MDGYDLPLKTVWSLLEACLWLSLSPDSTVYVAFSPLHIVVDLLKVYSFSSIVLFIVVEKSPFLFWKISRKWNPIVNRYTNMTWIYLSWKDFIVAWHRPILWRNCKNEMQHLNSTHFWNAGGKIAFVVYILCWEWIPMALPLAQGWQPLRQTVRWMEEASVLVIAVVGLAVRSAWWNVRLLCETWLLQNEWNLWLWLVAVMVRSWRQQWR